jgi:hypothetical protein
VRKTIVVLVACAALCVGITATSANAAPTWAPAASATIHPGVQTFTEGAQCTANFIFSDGTNVYIGQAAHCAGTGGNTETNGCTAGSLPLGTQVEVDGATRPGTIVYSSWLQMQADHETDESTCAYNDIALVKLDPADVSRVNPSIPFWGGPNGIDTNDTQLGENVYSYGNSSLRQGVTLLSPKRGISLGSTDGWTHNVYTVSPGIPGDSGSAFVNANGQALGVLSTLAIAPLPASNGVSDLASMLDYMRAHTGLDAVQLVNGTEPFTAGRLL